VLNWKTLIWLSFYSNFTSFFAGRLTSIPPDLGLCSELTDLNLSDNELAGLPSEIGQLVSLKYFDISKNQISRLPNDIGKLGNMESFDVRNNKIEYLPVELEALSARLQSLLVDGNDIKDPVRISCV
jgi:leucine-rich repeat protein SHOC2